MSESKIRVALPALSDLIIRHRDIPFLSAESQPAHLKPLLRIVIRRYLLVRRNKRRHYYQSVKRHPVVKHNGGIHMSVVYRRKSPAENSEFCFHGLIFLGLCPVVAKQLQASFLEKKEGKEELLKFIVFGLFPVRRNSTASVS